MTAARRRLGESGQTMIMVAILLPVMLGVSGLALDVGTLYHHRRRMQTAADAGALAGAHDVYRGLAASAVATAKRESGGNGFAHGTDGTTVTVHYPPVSGNHIADARFVEVVVDQPAPTWFMSLFGWNSVGVKARAVAGAGASGDNCIYALDPSMPSAFRGDSSARLTATCGVIVNSTSNTAMHLTSSAIVTAASVSVTGQYLEESSSDIIVTAPPGTPAISVPPAPDPLAYLPHPAVGACNHINWWRDSGVHNINPGVYCGGINLKNNARANMAPGIYIIAGGGIKTESNSELHGTGVMIYLTEKAGYPYAGLEFQSSSIIKLKAPTDMPPYTGILFFQDKNAGTPNVEHRFMSSTNATFEGALYFPTQVLRFESSTTTDAAYTIAVARVIRIESSANWKVSNNFGGLTGGSPIKKMSLVE